MSASDPDVTITLPLSAWSTVYAHLSRGIYAEVSTVIGAMLSQSVPQTEAAARALMEQTSKTPPEPEPAARYNIDRAAYANQFAQANNATGVNQTRDTWIRQSNPLYYVVGSAPQSAAGDMLKAMGSNRLPFLQSWVAAYKAGFAPAPSLGGN